MISPTDRALLTDMRDFDRTAVRILVRGGDAAVTGDEVLYLALCRAVEIVGEAANKVSKEIQAREVKIDWRGIIGMRHRLIHGYAGLSSDMVVRLARAGLPPLIEDLDRILGEPPV